MKKKKSYLNILSIAGVKPYKNNIKEKYMSNSQRNHFKKILKTWKSQLNTVIKKKFFQIQEKSINFPDPIDRATQEEEFNLELKKRDREHKLIQKINATLKRIENKTFGYCKICDIEIGIQRLEARPTTNLCIDCKTISELRNKQING